MAENRILFVNQEIAPYTPATPSSLPGREIAQAMQSQGFEVRTFMPKYGSVNERRNQLHEVIRLSGMNIPINDNDHPLILKVASMHPSRIQVYFIDNDDYFEKDENDADVVGSNRIDNDERAIFYAHSVAETIKKLKWEPGIIHVSGWLSALTPLYLKQMFAENHAFRGTKVVYEINSDTLNAPLDAKILDKMHDDKIPTKVLKNFKTLNPDTTLLHLLGIAGADGVVINTDSLDPAIQKALEESGKKTIVLERGETPEATETAKKLIDFYNTLK